MSAGETYFHVDVEAGSDPGRVVASGELDAATAATLATELTTIHDSGRGIALDLGGVTFIDSSGIRVIAAGRKRAMDSGQSFAVVGASEPVRRIFEMTGLAELLGS